MFALIFFSNWIFLKEFFFQSFLEQTKFRFSQIKVTVLINTFILYINENQTQTNNYVNNFKEQYNNDSWFTYIHQASLRYVGFSGKKKQIHENPQVKQKVEQLRSFYIFTVYSSETLEHNADYKQADHLFRYTPTYIDIYSFILSYSHSSIHSIIHTHKYILHLHAFTPGYRYYASFHQII